MESDDPEIKKIIEGMTKLLREELNETIIVKVDGVPTEVREYNKEIYVPRFVAEQEILGYLKVKAHLASQSPETLLGFISIGDVDVKQLIVLIYLYIN
jgi:hypothetical protein